MRKLSMIFILGMIVILSSFSVVSAEEQIVPKGMIVTGDALIEKDPDQTTIQFTILTNAKTSEEAQNQNAMITSRVYQSFLSDGLERKTWKTVQMNLSPQYDYSSSKAKLIGYQMVHRVMMVLPGTDRAGKIVNMLVDSGVTNIDSIQFGLQDPKAAQREALAAATRDAKEKAQIMAASSGAVITGVAYAGEPTYRYQPNVAMYDRKVMAASAPVAEQQVWASTIQVSARVEVRFNLSE